MVKGENGIRGKFKMGKMKMGLINMKMGENGYGVEWKWGEMDMGGNGNWAK